jgi:F0F1-type ATP synthase alpha subunit
MKAIKAKCTGKILEVLLGQKWLGVCRWTGYSIDGNGPIETKIDLSCWVIAPGVIERQSS